MATPPVTVGRETQPLRLVWDAAREQVRRRRRADVRGRGGVVENQLDPWNQS
jgi:hypothetical protein